MEHHNTPPMSESEQMYLLVLAMLLEDGQPPPVPLATLAHALALQPVSVNQMVRKLADAGLVTYLPYKGVELTSAGQAIALRVLRYRRLWEVFLVERLGMPGGEADMLACRLEHLTSDQVADRLAQFLGDPHTSPQGKPIPTLEAEQVAPAGIPLCEAACGQPLQVLDVGGDAVTRAFLLDAGLRPGVEACVLANASSGTLLLEVHGTTLRLAADVAAAVQVHTITPALSLALAGERRMG